MLNTARVAFSAAEVRMSLQGNSFFDFWTKTVNRPVGVQVWL
jgi:hypothetical protein